MSTIQASFWRPKTITYQEKVYYPIGDIVGPLVDNSTENNNTENQVNRFVGNLKISTKFLIQVTKNLMVII